MYLNYKKVGDVRDYSFTEQRTVTPLYSVGAIAPVTYINNPITTNLSVNISNFVSDIFVILNHIDEAIPLYIALAHLETSHAYTTNMWMIKGDTNGEFQFTGTQNLKEEELWYKKIKLMAFW